MDRVKIDSFSDEEEEEVDLNDAYLDQKPEVMQLEKDYETTSFLNAIHCTPRAWMHLKKHCGTTVLFFFQTKAKHLLA